MRSHREDKPKVIGQPTCPHCGGQHWGQRFDDCPYVRLVSDKSATEEQKHNAAEWLRLKREEDKTS
jgi:hypothetical protein